MSSDAPKYYDGVWTALTGTATEGVAVCTAPLTIADGACAAPPRTDAEFPAVPGTEPKYLGNAFKVADGAECRQACADKPKCILWEYEEGPEGGGYCALIRNFRRSTDDPVRFVGTVAD